MSWQEWLQRKRGESGMDVRRISLADTSGWGLQDDGCLFGRPDGAFFSLQGFRVRVSDNQREVAAWDQPMLVESGEGACVLVYRREEAHLHCLIVAKAEPGNAVPGCVLLAPTIQASKANLEQVHGGRRPPRAELLDNIEPTWVRMHQDGGRVRGKWNRYAVVRSSKELIGATHDTERWCHIHEVFEAVMAGECNEHLKQCVLLLLMKEGFVWPIST